MREPRQIIEEIGSTTANGFSLIELMVVISIISILSSLAIAALGSARLKAKDAQRLSDLRQLHTALSLYYDAEGSYPDMSPASWWVGTIVGQGRYLLQMPQDPTTKVAYSSIDNGTDTSDFCLYGQLDLPPRDQVVVTAQGLRRRPDAPTSILECYN